MATTTKAAKLAESIDCTGIHGITGREIDEGTLAAGALVRNVHEVGPDWLGHAQWEFLASTDGGAHWYRQRSYERPVTE